MHRLLVSLPLLLACNEAGLRVSNKAPEAQIVDPADGGQVADGYEVTLVGAATDEDNASAGGARQRAARREASRGDMAHPTQDRRPPARH